MNDMQQRFYDFFMDRVKSDKRSEAEELLGASFRKQDNGTFTKEYMMSVMPQLMACIRPEFLDELKQAAANMSANLPE